MAPPRRFNHDEAKRLYAEGWTKAALAELFRVSNKSIARVVSPRAAEVNRRNSLATYHRHYGVDKAWTERRLARNAAYRARKRAERGA